MRLIIIAVLVACAHATPQYVKSRYSGVKGGHSAQGYNGESLIRHFNNTQPGYEDINSRNQTSTVNYEKGVCYIEVPTASLARDPAHIPAGNGSRPDLSRIRTCCKGYIRNIHNFRICDPVCTNDCVNALCTEPEICTCFPDHVKNLAGFCIPTCPIGCQNGHCAGGECICKDGYRLDSESRFCVPVCRDNCGGIGNCTAPNTCECRRGYSSTSEGSCKPHCDRCGSFGECVAPNDCRCKPGYAKNQHGDCTPQCADNCRPNGRCVDVNLCHYPSTSTTTSNPNGQYYPGQNTPRNASDYPYSTRAPSYPYPGYHNQPHSDNQQSGYPDQQQPNYGNQAPYYPGHQRPNYLDQSSQHSHQQPSYPGNDQSNQPDNQRPNSSDNQPSNYPDQRPSKPNPQPIYYNPGQQQPNYPDSQHGYYNQRPNHPDSQQSNPNQPSGNSNEPYYPNNQYYPGQQYPSNQHYYPQNPQQQGNYTSSNNTFNPYPSYSSHQQSQNLYPDSQLANVETMCSKPCINGVCIEHDRCACNEGYILDETDPSSNRCKPYCPGGCPNGVCSSPYFCICNMGYRKDHSVKGRASCVKRIRRSAEPVNVAELLVFEIPEDEINDL